MKTRITFNLNHFFVGAFWDNQKSRLTIYLLPMIGIEIDPFKGCYD